MSWNFTASYRGFAYKGGPALSQICNNPSLCSTAFRIG